MVEVNDGLLLVLMELEARWTPLCPAQAVEKAIAYRATGLVAELPNDPPIIVNET